jgi:ketosteroid isomerase-like protein
MDHGKTDRDSVAQVVRDLHAARLRADLSGMCALFADSGHFRIAGSSDGKPVAIDARSVSEFRPWLAMLVKAFRVSDYALISMVVDAEHVAAHWQARIHSKITGLGVATELVDLATVQAGRIVAYTEFFVPR